MQGAQGSVRNFGGGGVKLNEGATFTMSGGRIQGGTASDGYAANTLNQNNQNAALGYADCDPQRQQHCRHGRHADRDSGAVGGDSRLLC